MLNIEKQLEDLRQWLESARDNVLSIYADVHPGKPENAGRAWRLRIKNALKELPEIRDRAGRRDEPLYEEVLRLLESERPEARTLAMFAHRDSDGRLHIQRLDLQVELPVVDLARGRVEARYGPPFDTPLWFAADEYQRAGILLLTGPRWRFLEVFLGEVREGEEVFPHISPADWKELEEASGRIADELHARSLRPGGRFEKLSPKDRAAARTGAWLHRMYATLARLLEHAADQLAIERLVLAGEHWQISHFETYLSRRIQRRVAARTPLWPEAHQAPAGAIWRHLEPVLLEAERRGEVALLEQVQEQSGLWGADAVLNALQLGRVRLWILPWSLDLRIWQCPEDGFVAASRETAGALCGEPREEALRDHVWSLAAQYGADLEFVRGEAEQRLIQEMGGMAALLRW
jgi:hypothetical protein